ncbi:hypothetical protein GA0070622_1225 [Micromonospora sediminicola]|uniref:Uncharacterized protein n=1 Tax=Micromonospora sediminicola TaxID=946078 RepID=A0A1A9B435_9ACTN|nr:hypothetical protein [Micromonospora sediminicola]SBT64255.1 hypothetical protein GA0070622_1225 [Micromonospora sediminicola]
MASILAGLRASAGEVAGLVLVVALVALVAWWGRRQEVRRADERRARAEARRRPPALDPAECGLPVDPWPHAEDHDVDRLTRSEIHVAVSR